jgi:hypothetical protein
MTALLPAMSASSVRVFIDRDAWWEQVKIDRLALRGVRTGRRRSIGPHVIHE